MIEILSLFYDALSNIIFVYIIYQLLGVSVSIKKQY